MFADRFGTEPNCEDVVLGRDCSEVLYNGDPSTKVDIVFVPDRYTDINLWNSDVEFFSDFEGVNDGFFSVEPMKSYKNRFNIWQIDELNHEYWDLEGGQLSGESIKTLRDLAKGCFDSDYIFLIKDNSDGSIPSGGWAPKNNMVFVTKLRNGETATRTFVHEAGHALGTLNNDYRTGISTQDNFFTLFLKFLSFKNI